MPPRVWRPADPTIPRNAVLPLSNTVRAALGPDIAAIDALIAGKLADDLAVIGKGEAVTVDEELNGRSYTTIKFPIALAGRSLLAGYTIDVTERKRAEEALRQQQAELSVFDTVGVDRELAMIDLKREVNALAVQLGQAAPYDVGFADAPPQDPP